MAQVCGGSNFDFVASRKHDAAKRVLARAADVWAMHGKDSLSVDSIIAVLLRILLSERFGYRDETRHLEAWMAMVGTSDQEVETWIPTPAGLTTAELLASLHEELTCAVEQWVLGDPEQPPTAHALNAIEHVLFTHKLTTRPAALKSPKTLRNIQSNAPNF